MKKTDYSLENWTIVPVKGLKIRKQYQISDFGRIRCKDKKTDDWKIVKQSANKGYFLYTFTTDDKLKPTITKAVHKLVAELFCKKKSNDVKFVIHLDFDKSNNHIDNLKWVNRKDLVLHHRNSPSYENRRFRNAKLSIEDVIKLKKKLLKGDMKLYKLAREFGITHTQLNRIRSGENWGNVTLDK